MKRRIPASTDELMWLLAEQRDSAAIDSFCSRYPDLRSELLRRVNMVHDLKAARGEPSAPSAVPPFRPHEYASTPIRPWMRWTVAAVGLCSVAWAAFFATSQFMGSAPTRSVATDAAQSSPVALGTPAPSSKNDAAPPVRAMEPKEDVSSKDRPPTPPPMVDDGIQPITRPLDKVITIRLESATLLEALGYISKASKVKITAGPGLKDQLVTLDYVKRPALEVLKDLGATAGFTVFEQGDAEVLLIPSTMPEEDTSAPPQDPGHQGPSTGSHTAKPESMR